MQASMATRQVDSICTFIGETFDRPLTHALREAAKQCLVDWFAVGLAALGDPAPSIARQQMRQWSTRGRAMNLYGDMGAPAAVALVNATLSHSLDFDDMHFGSVVHASGPTLAALFAVALDRGATEDEVLNAFVTGYEIGTAIGDEGLGPRLAAVGWHPTGVLGHFASVSAVAALMRLTREQTAYALGLAATQAAGLQASGGTMAKPFHVGKAAMNGVMAAELASLGMDASTFIADDPQRGILGCLLQQPVVARLHELGRSWRIEDNTFKPYAACQLTHAAHETARGMAEAFHREGLQEIRIFVNPLAPKVAGRERADTPMEGKFSLAYCVALGLRGYSADISGFTEQRLADADLRDLVSLAKVMPCEDVQRCAARIDLDYGGGRVVHGRIDAVRGSPGRPLSWIDLEEKFFAALPSTFGDRAAPLLKALRAFEEPGSMTEVWTIVGSHRNA